MAFKLSGGRTFASLALPNYRYFFLGALVSNIGTWMARTSQDWLVLTELTNHSSSALGIVTALQFLAIPLLAPVSGAIADRYPKRRILVITQALLGLNAFIFFSLVASGWANLWHVYLLALTQGIVTAFDMPCRQAFVSEMVDTSLLPNAVGLNSMSFNGARLIGPGLAGLVIASVGVAPSIAINGLSFVAMIIALTRMKPELLHPAPLRKGRGSIREGLSYVLHRPDIMMILLLAFVLGTFGMNFQITNATMADKIFGRGAASYGLMGTIMAIGTFAGALLAARRRRPRLGYLLLALGGFAVFDLVLSAAPSYWAYCALLVPVGLCALTAMTSSNSTVQLACEPDKRGRVMAVYAAINTGGTPIGAPIIGWVGDACGPRWSLAAGGLAVGIACTGALWYLMAHRGMRFWPQRGWPPRVHVWTTDETVAAENAGQPRN